MPFKCHHLDILLSFRAKSEHKILFSHNFTSPIQITCRDAGECLGDGYKHVVTIRLLVSRGGSRDFLLYTFKDTSQTIQTMGKNGQK